MKKQRNKLGPFNYDEYEVPSFADTCEGNDVTMEIVEIPDPEDQQIEHFFVKINVYYILFLLSNFHIIEMAVV